MNSPSTLGDWIADCAGITMVCTGCGKEEFINSERFRQVMKELELKKQEIPADLKNRKKRKEIGKTG